MNKLFISQQLRYFRNKLGFTQKQIASALNIDRSTYAYYETGKSIPDIFTFITLSNIVQLSLDQLVNCARSREGINHHTILSLSKDLF